MPNRTLKVLLTAALVVGGVGFLMYSSVSEAEYYKHVDELMSEPGSWTQRTLRVHGFVQAGSLDEKIVGQKTEREFVLEYNGQQIRVRNSGPKPDNFRDLAEVVAKGTVVPSGDGYVLEATELSAKCPSKYEGAERTKDYGKSANSSSRPSTGTATTYGARAP